MKCEHNQQRLQAWHDGERDPEAALWSTQCSSCAAQLAAWQVNQAALRAWARDRVPEIEPLSGLQVIRQRVALAESASASQRLQQWFSDLWLMHRNALVGAGVAAMLGIVTAPALIHWTNKHSFTGEDALAAVVVESLEFDGDAEARIVQADGGDTTIIWIEPHGNADHEPR